MGYNSQIVKNTLISYFQIMVTTIVGVVSSRLVLQALGVSDFGLYNVVGGIISLFAIISNAMTMTSIRYLSFEIGKQKGNVNKVFNISNVLHIGTAIVVIVILETIGLFYVLNYLKIEPGKESDALFVFQISCLISFLSIINIPFKSVFVACEKFTSIAVIEIIGSLMKLAAIAPLFLIEGNGLRIYAVAMLAAISFTFVIYHVLAIKRWPQITSWNLVTSLGEYKAQISYSNWSMLNTASLAARSYGSDILINLFFGTVLNAAFAITRSVQGFSELLSQNFSKVAFPKVVKSMGDHHMEEALGTIYFIGRCNLLLLELSFFCIYVELDFLLHIWLGSHVPYGSLVFCKLILWIALLAGTGGGLYQFVKANGRLQEYNIITAVFYLSGLPISFFLYRAGSPYYMILVIFLVMEFCCRIAQLVMLKKVFNFDVIRFMKESWIKPTLVFVILLSYMLLYHHVIRAYTYINIIGIALMLVVAISVVFYIGLKDYERIKLKEFLLTILKALYNGYTFSNRS